MSNSDLREVYSARDSTDAYFMKNVLEAEGIDAHLVGDALQNAIGDLPVFAVEPKLLVQHAEFDRAKQIVRAEETRRHDPSGSTWTCATCGETNEPSFDLCWSCQESQS
jgi:hypothetical protein